MPTLTYAVLRTQIVSGETLPLYMLVGADDLEKAAVASEFAEIVEEDLRAFNVERLYGGEMKVDDLVDAASTLPMMAPRRVIVIHEAEKLLIPKRESKAADEEQERLEAFIETPPAHATVVFVCGALDMRRRLVKRLARDAQVVDCGTIESEADAERWVKARAARERVNLEPAAARALVERAGIDIRRLRAGLERLALYSLGQTTITVDDVRQAVVAGPEAQADFGIAKAVWRNDAREALKELGLALESGAVPVMVMGQLRAAAEKLPAPRLAAAIDAVFRTDLALKSSGGDPRILLERLVVELCEQKSRVAFSGRRV
ncbi:MAG TPA: DNA polymerase III subunit delta [Vicinamibacterales bacterium]|nr:DNA polymerase III subunit delta [Vicinamibacterales bacterium]